MIGQNKRQSVTSRGILILILALAALLAGCSKQADQTQAARQPTVPVETVAVSQRMVPLQIAAIGNVEALATVDVRSQIAGQVVEVHFTEGQDVNKGQLLFTLDRRPFEAALNRAEGQLGRDAAQAKHARVQAERYARLFKEGVVAREQLDSMVSNAEAMEATVQADQAAVEAAKVDLQYTRITAPQAGRTGDVMVHSGNVVKANETVLVKINQVSPIDVSFSLPEQQLAEVKRHAAGGKLKVQAQVEGGEPSNGSLSFIDNAVNPQTGTIKLKATFPNKERTLWPGQFVNVVMTLREERDAIVVPTRAVQTGQQGDYVYVVKSDMTAESRQVVVARSHQGDSVITSGLQPGEQVVVEGHLRIAPGMKVQVKNGSQAKEIGQ